MYVEKACYFGENRAISTKWGLTMKTRSDPSTKPYYKCLSCPRFRKLCGGIPTREMDLKEWCEYMRDVSDHFHLTNDYIAQASEVSGTTVDRVMAINVKQDRKSVV